MQLSLHNNETDWDVFREKLDYLISKDQPFQTETDIRKRWQQARTEKNKVKLKKATK